MAAGAGSAVLGARTRWQPARRWREVVPVALLALLCALGALLWATPDDPEPTTVDMIAVAVMLLLIVAWGMYIGSRRELLTSWRSRAELAEAEQDARVQHARAAERGRIAREMLSPERVHEALVTVAELTATALTELREGLGVLRDDPGDAEPERPQSGAADLPALVEENRSHGMNLVFDCEADIDSLPDSVGSLLYRCAREALTNARKHAPATAVSVRISGNEEHGGGRQPTHVTADERFVLSVWLPWRA